MTLRWQAVDPWADIRAMVSAAFDQRAFRFRNDDGSETTATWKAAQNVAISQPVGEVFRLRIEVQETAGGSANNQTIVLQANVDSGGWFNVGPASTMVQLRASPNVPSSTPTTNQLTAGTGTFLPGLVLTESSGTDISFSGNDHTEVEWAHIILEEGEVAAGSTILFRVTINGSLANTVTASPSLTATIPAGPRDVSGTAGGTSTAAGAADVAVDGPELIVAPGASNAMTLAKPRKQLWFHDGHWWIAAVPEGSTSYFAHRRDDVGVWTQAGLITTQTTRRLDIDVQPNGTIHWYGWRSAVDDHLVGRATYNSGTKTYTTVQYGNRVGDPALPNWSSMALPNGATDSAGRYWVVGADPPRYMVFDPSQFDTGDPILLGLTDIPDEDYDPVEHLCRVVAFNDATGPAIGVILDAQASDEMRFWVHRDSGPLDSGWTLEVIDGTADTADDHGDVVATPGGEVLATWKTEAPGAAAPNIMYARRTTAGVWTDVTVVRNRFGSNATDEYTAPRISYDATNDRVYVGAYDRVPGTRDVHVWVSDRLSPNFGSGTADHVIVHGDELNNFQFAPHHVDADSGLMVAAEASTEWVGLLVEIESAVWVDAAGAAAGSSSVSAAADVVVNAEMLDTSGTVAGTSTASGAADVQVGGAPLDAAGTTAGTATLTGQASLIASTAATTSGSSSTTGDATSLQAASGDATGTSTATGSADVQEGGAPLDAAGTAAGESNVTGTATSYTAATGHTAGTSSVTASASALLVATGSVAGTSTATGQATVLGPDGPPPPVDVELSYTALPDRHTIVPLPDAAAVTYAAVADRHTVTVDPDLVPVAYAIIADRHQLTPAPDRHMLEPAPDRHDITPEGD